MDAYTYTNEKTQIKQMAEMFKQIKRIAKRFKTTTGQEMGNKITEALEGVVEPYVNETYIKLTKEENERNSDK